MDSEQEREGIRECMWEVPEVLPLLSLNLSMRNLIA